ncbi:hypothetical protein DPMN_026528 [Dreissena polymorpha]|uniref:Uncharacterized protein n=1 Tax=Dreissena polymorpha TaxID=45954 RepID=A0A9D4LTJ8_DREPO|nr:hypothetical protein DPMN_026528 [Dreissena polymorpha]
MHALFPIRRADRVCSPPDVLIVLGRDPVVVDAAWIWPTFWVSLMCEESTTDRGFPKGSPKGEQERISLH